MPFNTASSPTVTAVHLCKIYKSNPCGCGVVNVCLKRNSSFSAKIFLVYCVIGAAIANLSLQQGENKVKNEYHP